jgi:hypothetical protein
MNETDLLREELEHYRQEKESVRRVIGEIGGRSSKRVDRSVNIAFIILVFTLFAFDIFRNMVSLEIPHVPEMVFLELAVLLVSVKIIWMIHRQSKVEHFQFWILNSIEFQMTAMVRRMSEIEAMVRESTREDE